MNISIIGAGFTGMSAAWRLTKRGHSVTIYERESVPGGLAAGFSDAAWKWSLEHHYHHIFTSDRAILQLLKEMGLDSRAFFKTTRTAVRYDDTQKPLDSPLSLLSYAPLSLVSRLRTGIVLLFLKLFPLGKLLEKITAERFIRSTMGTQSWKILWEPLFKGKFGQYASRVNAAWFWARIHVRSQKLGYFSEGFASLASAMVDALREVGVVVHFNSTISELSVKGDSVEVQIGDKKGHKRVIYDQVLVSAPAEVLLRMSKSWTRAYRSSLSKLKGLSAQTLVLELDKPFFRDKTYWLNINEESWPFLAVVEHTNFVSRDYYGGRHLVYVGNYLTSSSNAYAMDKEELLALYKPYLEFLSPGFMKHVCRTWEFKSLFAQPIPFVNHGNQIPSMRTEMNHVFWASMQHVYPWDRGTNYAVSLGDKVAAQMGTL